MRPTRNAAISVPTAELIDAHIAAVAATSAAWIAAQTVMDITPSGRTMKPSVPPSHSFESHSCRGTLTPS